MRTGLALLALLLLVSLPTGATADVVRPPSSPCPDGHTAKPDHGGGYCQPPPPEDCPPGHAPRVYRHEAYCEPPPEAPCPTGAVWFSKSATSGRCVVADPCFGDVCPDGGACVATSFCLKARGHSRYSLEPYGRDLHGTCESQQDCGASPMTCVREFRCEPPPELKRRPVGAEARGVAVPPLADPAAFELPDVEPAQCDDRACPDGLSCEPLGLCLGGRGPLTRPVPGETKVFGPCPPEGSCPEGSYCDLAYRCVRPRGAGEATPAPEPASEGGCGGCALRAPSAAPGATVVPIALLLWWRRRSNIEADSPTRIGDRPC